MGKHCERDVFRRERRGKRLASLTRQRRAHKRLTTLTRKCGKRLPACAASVGVERLQLRSPGGTRIRRKPIDPPRPISVRDLGARLIAVHPPLEIANRTPDSNGTEL
jgi:hypothetical protein